MQPVRRVAPFAMPPLSSPDFVRTAKTTAKRVSPCLFLFGRCLLSLGWEEAAQTVKTAETVKHKTPPRVHPPFAAF